MGQKVNPIGFRTGINRDWQSTWFAGKEYGSLVIEDIKIRKYLEAKLKDSMVSRVCIEKASQTLKVDIHTARPGAIMGQDGALVKELAKNIRKLVSNKEVKINIVEIKNPDLDATLLAQSMAEQLEKRASFRIVQKKIIQRARKAGAKGVKTLVSGRLAGADIAREEGYSEGIVPLHTIRQDIDYGFAEAHTTFGRIGCKVWLSKGDIIIKKDADTSNNPSKEGD